MARTWLGALAIAALLLAAFAAPISAAPERTRLSSAAVSPRTGTPATTIVISVVYQNEKGSRAESVSARIGSTDQAMSRVPGGSWGQGVTFRWSGTVAAGTHTVVISARAKDKSTATLGAGSVTISPPATPTPRPTATPKSTPKPTPRPTATPKPTPRPTTRTTAAPSASATAVPTAVPVATAQPTVQPSTPPVATRSGEPGSSPAATLGPVTSQTPVPSATSSAPPITTALGGSGATQPPPPPGGAIDPGPTGVGGSPSGGRGPLAGILAMVGLQGPSFTGLSLGPTLVTTTGAVAMGMAFGLFGRRRRDDETGDDVMALAAATGVGVAVAPGAAVVDGVAAGSDEVRESEDMEALMPRWRRPSLLQARKADPIRDNTPAPRLTFDHGLVGPLDGRERKVIRYRVVRLLDSPDELRGQEVGYLDHGDEVQLLEKYGAYWLVLSPDGQQGWLHKMTLGNLIEEDAPPSEGPVATMPIGAESWTMGEADIDGDVFEAYLESRRRRGD